MPTGYTNSVQENIYIKQMCEDKGRVAVTSHMNGFREYGGEFTRWGLRWSISILFFIWGGMNTDHRLPP